MGDPHSYITPDCVADFTTVRLNTKAVTVFASLASKDGRQPILQVSISYSGGYKSCGTLVYLVA
jgi:hypothetical protein